MKTRRTPIWDRKTYRYYFSNGDKSIVSVGKVTNIHNGTMTVIFDKTITEEVIAFLHHLDDREVRNNLKEINFEDYAAKKERLKNKKEWEINHPYEENPYEKAPKVIRLSLIGDDDTLERIENYLYQHTEEDDDSENGLVYEERKRQLEEFVSTLTPSMQELFDLLYIQELNQNQISQKLKVERSTILRRKRLLDEKILKKFSKKCNI